MPRKEYSVIVPENVFPKPSKDFVERMTGHMSMDGTNTNHATETHEVGKEEMIKMLDFVKQKLNNH